MKAVVISSVVLGVVVAFAALAPAQSLGDVARQEAERRKTVRTSGKVYTNDSLRTEPAPAVSTPAAPTPSVTTPSASTPAAPQMPPAAGSGPAASEAAKAPGTEGPKDEAYWQKRLTAERDALSRAQTFAEALQSRINALSTDFVNRDDPAQRAVIAADRDKALAELERVRQEIVEHQKAITAIRDEARRAGVPAGWVR